MRGVQEPTEFIVMVSVDGTPVDTGAPDILTDGGCGNETWLGNIHVGPGKHQVTLNTYLPNLPTNVTQQNWSVNYMVTTP